MQEEENGIEMSEDFGGKSQNLEQEEGDENDDEEDGDELEKEMGETGEEADNLDQKVCSQFHECLALYRLILLLSLISGVEYGFRK